MNTGHTLLSEVPDKKVSLIITTLQFQWYIVGFLMTGQMGIQVLHQMVSVYEEVTAHMKGHEGLSGQVRNPVT